MMWALGIAATQASGLREMFGTMCKPFHPGRAAQRSSRRASRAARTSPARTRASRRSAASRTCSRPSSTRTRSRNSSARRWEISLNTYKPFACGIVIHPIIDACIQLRNEHGFEADDIESIEPKVHPLVLELTGKKTPQTGLEGKFSVYHSCAAAIVHGRCGEHEYLDEVVTDPEIVNLRGKVRAEASPKIHEDQVDITLTTTDGRSHRLFVEHAIGSLERPLSDEELDRKVRDLCEPVIGTAGSGRLIEACRGVEKAAALKSVVDASCPKR